VTKISLEKAFNSYFHDKHSFDSFCNLDIDTQYDDIFYSKNTFSPSTELKRYQRFLNFFIFDFMKVNENVVFSYRKGVSSYDALYPHKDSRYILSTDIKSFFLHIDKEDIRSLILRNKKNYLIKEEDIEQYLDRLVNLVSYNDILPIGAPTSPKISNAYLFEFDNKLEEYCKNNEIIYTRYSDDFIFSSDTKDRFNTLLDEIKGLFISSNLTKFELNISKTKLQKKGSKVTLLGLVITPNGTITVDKKIKREVEVLLHFYLSDKEKFKDFFEKNYDSNLEKVSGRLSHIKSIDRQFISKLKRKYGSYIVNSFIHRDIDE
jgi:RNA-directed DNA polymerase